MATNVYPFNCHPHHWEELWYQKKVIELECFTDTYGKPDIEGYWIDQETIAIAIEGLSQEPSAIRSGFGVFPTESEYSLMLVSGNRLDVKNNTLRLMTPEGEAWKEIDFCTR